MLKKLYKSEEAFRAAIISLAVLVLLGQLYAKLSSAISPFVFAIVLASLLNPGVNRLQKLGIPRSIGAALLTIAVVVSVVFIIGLVSFFIQKHVSLYTKNINSNIEFLADWFPKKLSALSDRIHLPIEIKAENIRDYIMSSLGDIAEALGRYAGSIYSKAKSVVGMFSFLFLVPILTFYLVKDWPKCTAKTREYTPDKILAFTDFALPRAKSAIKNEVSGQFKVASIVLFIYSIGLWAIGMKSFVLLGMISAVLTFIPFLGIFVAFVLVILFAIAQGLSFMCIVMITVLYFIGSSIESNFLTPHFVGEKIGLHPVWIFFAVLAMSACVGVVGTIFVMPLATLVWSLIQSTIAWMKRTDVAEQ
ncbi:MAG: AI-2E family transporter [Holosporales bacterium]|jgi:predicted PurR-regulated permease PerM|nr:AI-2E family transporter [Holosporales bacterium]